MAKPLKIRKISPDDQAKKAATRILRTRIKEFYSHWPNPDHTPTPEQLHDLRISGKRLRYSAESLREFYPDRLALLIDLLKRNQDLLGEIQDCVTQRGVIEERLNRAGKRGMWNEQTASLEKIISEYDERQSALFAQFHEIWRGMTLDEFRRGLKAMVIRAKEVRQRRPAEDHETREPVLRAITTAESFPVDETGDETRAETIVNIDDRNV